MLRSCSPIGSWSVSKESYGPIVRRKVRTGLPGRAQTTCNKLSTNRPPAATPKHHVTVFFFAFWGFGGFFWDRVRVSQSVRLKLSTLTDVSLHKRHGSMVHSLHNHNAPVNSADWKKKWCHYQDGARASPKARLWTSPWYGDQEMGRGKTWKVVYKEKTGGPNSWHDRKNFLMKMKANSIRKRKATTKKKMVLKGKEWTTVY